jgi:hypothetical protein
MEQKVTNFMTDLKLLSKATRANVWSLVAAAMMVQALGVRQGQAVWRRQGSVSHTQL